MTLTTPPVKAVANRTVEKASRNRWSRPRLDAAAARRLFVASAWVKPPTAVLEAVRSIRSPAAWETAAVAAQQVHQEPLFHLFITRHFPQAPLTLETRNQLETQKRFHVFRWEELRESLEGVIEALLETNIRPLLLKGAGTLGDLYHLPRLRPMRDVDLLVHPSELDVAHRALLDWGFVHSDDLPDRDFVAHHHLAPLFHPSTGICVELHHRPLCRRSMLPGVPELDEFWRAPEVSALAVEHEAQAVLKLAARTVVMEPTLQFLVTCLHFTHGDHIAWRTAHFFDLARTLELHGPAVDWDRLLKWATGRELSASLALTLACLETEGLSTAPPEVRTTLWARAGAKNWEKGLVTALLRRYRMSLPPPWRAVSPRVANILWDGAFSRASVFRRSADVLRRILSRGAGSEAERRIAASHALAPETE